MPSVCNAVGLLTLLKLCPVFTFLQQLMTKRLWVIYTYTCFPMFSIDVIASAPDDPCIYLLIVGSHYCVMRFAYVLHMRQQNLVLFPCLYIGPFELVIEVIFHYCSTPPWQKINLFKRPFRGSRFERLEDAFELLVILIFLYPQRILISITDYRLKLMYSFVSSSCNLSLMFTSSFCTFYFQVLGVKPLEMWVWPSIRI